MHNDFEETIFEHLSGNRHYTISTGERKMVNKLKKLREQFPDEVRVISENADGSILVHIPSGWVQIRPKRKKELSEEERRMLRSRLSKI